MNRTLIGVLSLAVWSGSALAADPVSSTSAPTSGIDLQFVDSSVRLQDDFFRHVSGKWLDTVQIPADRARFGAFDALRELAEQQLRDVIEELARNNALPAGSDPRRIADLYHSFLDEARIERQGLRPLQSELARIDALADKRDIPRLLAHLTALGATVPFRFFVNQDARESTRYAVYLNQGGLGLPDRDYYLKDDDARLKGIRAEYLNHIEKMLTMAGIAGADKDAQAILQLETGFAKAQWTNVENRDPVKTYNKTEIEKFGLRAKALAAQYSAYSLLSGYNISGELTLGENIADNSGLAIAQKAYRISLGGREAPVIDGFTGDQRLYLGWAQVWRGKARDAETIRLIKVDNHSPAMFRCNAALVNQAGFYAAFDVKETDKMFVPPEKRVSIW